MKTQTKNKASSNELKDEQLRKTVQGSKLVKLELSQSEMAKIAGLSKSSIGHDKSTLINGFWTTESNTPNEDKKYLLEKCIDIGIDHVLKDEPNLESLFGVILGSYLKVETNALDSIDSLRTVWTIGKHLTAIYKLICKYKNKKRVSIHSEENKSAKYLLKNKEMLDKLFLRSDDYKCSKYSKRWTSTELLIKHVEISINKFLEVISLNADKLGSLFPLSCPYMSPSNDAKKDTQKSFFTGFKIYYHDIYPQLIIDIDTLKQFEINSIFSLLIRAVGITKDRIQIPIKHESKKSEEYWGRNYNIFCSLRSRERLQLGFISYDMSAALQSISLHIINATESDYPMLWKYAHDKSYKKQIRTEIAQDLKHFDAHGNIDTSEVKSQLTAFAHGSTKNISKHKYYAVFQEESNRLRKAVLKHVSELDPPKILERAIEQSSRELPEEIDWMDLDIEETAKDVRDKASVFFFVWTWYEREIRQAMIDALGNNEASEAFEVHDAVYSRKDIDPKIIGKEIYDQTSFSITIEKEYLNQP